MDTSFPFLASDSKLSYTQIILCIMSHLWLHSLLVKLNLSFSLTDGNMSLLRWPPAQREWGC